MNALWTKPPHFTTRASLIPAPPASPRLRPPSVPISRLDVTYVTSIREFGGGAREGVDFGQWFEPGEPRPYGRGYNGTGWTVSRKGLVAGGCLIR